MADIRANRVPEEFKVRLDIALSTRRITMRDATIEGLETWMGAGMCSGQAATAKFSPEWETEVEAYGDSWVVAGWVDSQNIYGALIRQRYRITLKSVEDDKWQASEVLVFDR